jgi:hypothetical protein
LEDKYILYITRSTYSDREWSCIAKSTEAKQLTRYLVLR